MNEPMPWLMKPLDEWSIVGMNHYHIDGKRHLFVAMVKGDRCIKEEGADDQYIWNRLWRKATEVDTPKLSPRAAWPFPGDVERDA